MKMLCFTNVCPIYGGVVSNLTPGKIYDVDYENHGRDFDGDGRDYGYIGRVYSKVYTCQSDNQNIIYFFDKLNIDVDGVVTYDSTLNNFMITIEENRDKIISEFFIND